VAYSVAKILDDESNVFELGIAKDLVAEITGVEKQSGIATFDLFTGKDKNGKTILKAKLIGFAAE